MTIFLIISTTIILIFFLLRHIYKKNFLIPNRATFYCYKQWKSDYTNCTVNSQKKSFATAILLNSFTLAISSGFIDNKKHPHLEKELEHSDRQKLLNKLFKHEDLIITLIGKDIYERAQARLIVAFLLIIAWFPPENTNHGINMITDYVKRPPSYQHNKGI